LLPAIFADALLGSTFYVYGLGHSDLAVGATLTSLAPLVSVPIAIGAGEERWNAARVLAVLATVVGVVILMIGG
jgi:drug/metabolite transporter (DMT)-like permease